MMLAIRTSSRVFLKTYKASDLDEATEEINEQLTAEEGQTISLRSLDIQEVTVSDPRAFVIVKAIFDVCDTKPRV